MGINQLDLNLLKVFVAVAEEGNFTKAAERLFIEQPSVSRSIQRLEQEIKTALFLRTKRSVRLTTKGSDLLRVAKNILSSSRDFLRLARDQEMVLSGTIKFAAENPISSVFLPSVLERLSEEVPLLWPMMYTGITEDVIRRIHRGDLEFGLFFYEGTRLKGLEYQELADCEFKLVAAKTIKKENLNSFIGSREINDSISVELPTVERLKKINKAIQIKYSANDLYAYRELILRGLGIGLLPAIMIQEDLRKKKLNIIYPELKLNFKIKLVTRKGVPLSLEAQRIISWLCEDLRG